MWRWSGLGMDVLQRVCWIWVPPLFIQHRNGILKSFFTCYSVCSHVSIMATIIIAFSTYPQWYFHLHSKLKFRKCLDNALRNMIWLLGSPVWSQQLDSVISVDPFQFRIFYDSLCLLIQSHLHQDRFGPSSSSIHATSSRTGPSIQV